jgi:branched-chain amino acid transport system ATP-binding protein
MLEVVQLHAGYRRMIVLHGISLTVGAGEIVSLIGSNGAGKSTTLRTISGLVALRDGQIRFKGSELNRRPAEVVKSGISQVPEGRRLFGDMTVHENLLLGAYTCATGELAERIEQVYDLFPQVRQRSRQHAGSLSGGEQQMVAIGRGLMAKPQLLMLDEPSMGLAPKLVAQLADIIKRIRSLGISVLLVEQNARLALEIADRAYVLQMGTIVTQGPSATLRDDPFVRRAYLGL